VEEGLEVPPNRLEDVRAGDRGGGFGSGEEKNAGAEGAVNGVATRR